MNPRIRVRWTAAAAALAAVTALGLVTTGAGGSHPGAGTAAVGIAAGRAADATPDAQRYAAACPSADQVTPALGTNLIANPGAEDYTAVTSFGEPSTDTQTIPDCWTATSPMGGAGAVLESATVSGTGGTGSREFYGGYDYDSPQVSIVGVTTKATQLIDVSGLAAGGEDFTFTGEIGGYTTQADYATVTAEFEDASGKALGSSVLGPVDAAHRNNATGLVPQAAVGTVPAGTTQILVTVASTGVSSGYGIDGRADNLNLTLSAGAAQHYAAPCPAADKVTPALDANLIANPGAEDWTAAADLGAPAADGETVADCWTSDSPLPAPDGTQESRPSTSPGVRGSRVFYGGANPSTVAVAGVVTTGSQLIDIGALDAAGKPFALTGDVGGYSTQSDYAEVTATFEAADGSPLGTASIGPATPADRGNTSELIFDGDWGTVPAGAAKVLVTVITQAINGGANSDGTADNLNLTIGQSVVGQHYTAPCPTADKVAPALDANLIANPGAEDWTAATALGAPIGDDQTVADCWTSSSPLNAPDGVQESRTSSYPGVVGSRDFYGGTNPSTVSIPGTTTTGTQSIDVGALDVSGKPFELSAALGGYATQSDYATVSATFEGADGDRLGSAVIGPVTAAQRNNVSSLIHQAWYGTVPSGTAKIVVAIATVGVSSGANLDGAADDLDLTIGGSAAPKGPVLQTMPYTSVGGTAGTHVDPGSGAVIDNVLPGALYRPAGVSVRDGSVYVTNTGDSLVATEKDGATAVIAGSLEGYGEKGDGGKAGAATMYQPAGTAEDARGDVFIADSGDNTVREVTPDGVIHRFAGTGEAGGKTPGHAALDADLDHPEAVAVGASGDVYIADTYNNRVLEVSSAGWVLRVIGTGRAGYSGDGGDAGRARLDMPIGLALDTAGNLYLADSANNVVRRVDAASGVITTVAGDHAADQAASDGLGGFSGDGGPATSARLNDPQGVALDGAGDLFVADTFNHAIREVTPDGVISTVVNSSARAGGESSGAAPADSKLNTPFAVAVDPSTDLLYIADTKNSAVAEVLGVAKSGSAAGPTAPSAS